METAEYEVVARDLIERLSSDSHIAATRLDDGSVMLAVKAPGEGGVSRVTVQVVPAEMWCDLIASVRIVEDTPEGRFAARVFHGIER